MKNGKTEPANGTRCAWCDNEKNESHLYVCDACWGGALDKSLQNKIQDLWNANFDGAQTVSIEDRRAAYHKAVKKLKVKHVNGQNKDRRLEEISRVCPWCEGEKSASAYVCCKCSGEMSANEWAKIDAAAGKSNLLNYEERYMVIKSIKAEYDMRAKSKQESPKPVKSEQTPPIKMECLVRRRGKFLNIVVSGRYPEEFHIRAEHCSGVKVNGNIVQIFGLWGLKDTFIRMDDPAAASAVASDIVDKLALESK